MLSPRKQVCFELTYTVLLLPLSSRQEHLDFTHADLPCLPIAHRGQSPAPSDTKVHHRSAKGSHTIHQDFQAQLKSHSLSLSSSCTYNDTGAHLALAALTGLLLSSAPAGAVISQLPRDGILCSHQVHVEIWWSVGA